MDVFVVYIFVDGDEFYFWCDDVLVGVVQLGDMVFCFGVFWCQYIVKMQFVEVIICQLCFSVIGIVYGKFFGIVVCIDLWLVQFCQFLLYVNGNLWIIIWVGGVVDWNCFVFFVLWLFFVIVNQCWVKLDFMYWYVYVGVCVSDINVF